MAAAAAAGASGCTFHIEVMPSITAAVELAARVRTLGMVPGVALAPDTDIAAVLPLIRQGAVDLVSPGARQRLSSSRCRWVHLLAVLGALRTARCSTPWPHVLSRETSGHAPCPWGGTSHEVSHTTWFQSRD